MLSLKKCPFDIIANILKTQHCNKVFQSKKKLSITRLLTDKA